MHTCVTTFGTAGDIRPLLAIATALRRRGHDVTLPLNPFDHPLATEALPDCTVITAGELWSPADLASTPRMLHRRHGSLAMLTDLYAPRAASLYKAILNAHERTPFDAVISHHVSFGAGWAAQQLGVPWVLVTLAPAAWPSVHDPNLYPGMPRRLPLPPSAIRQTNRVAKHLISKTLDPILNRQRRELGLAPQRSMLFSRMDQADLILGLWSPAFRPPVRDDPPNAHIVGFVRLPHLRGELPEPADDLIASCGEPPIALTLGSSAVHSGHDLQGLAQAVASATGRGVVLLDGTQRDAPHQIAAGVFACTSLPHPALFERCALVIHHAGMGTVGEVVHAGLPSVAVPFTHDQPDNARRLERLGVGRAVWSTQNIRGIARASNAILGDDAARTRASELQRAVIHDNGIEVSADLIERTVADAVNKPWNPTPHR